MLEIDLVAIPNQSLSVRLENNQYNISIIETRGCMSITIIKNNEMVIQNVRAVGGVLLIPYRYLETGNFFIDTLDNDLPDYTKFGISQSLVYISQAELGAIRAGT